MTADRRDDEIMDELLSLADGPVRFPEPARSELRSQMIRTAAGSRAEPSAVVQLAPDQRGVDRRRHGWVVGAAASLLLVVAVALALAARTDDRSQAPGDQVLPAPMTVEEVCAALPPLAAANGLAGGSVQVGDVSLDDLDEVSRMLAALSVDAGGTVDAEAIDGAITRIRLLEIAIESSDANAAATAMTAARASVVAVIDSAC